MVYYFVVVIYKIFMYKVGVNVCTNVGNQMTQPMSLINYVNIPQLNTLRDILSIHDV